MKLLKYVMTSDTGLAPNPFHNICSLAVCTPNHVGKVGARLEIGDWIVGHSCKETGWKLIHAMRVTRIVPMPEYHETYPQKRPDPNGSRIEQCGDNLYYVEAGKWRREPSPCHNTVDLFRHDRGRLVFLAEGSKNYWYFGGIDDPFTTGFPNDFPELIKDRHGISYVRDENIIKSFVDSLAAYGQSGKIGSPRDEPDPRPEAFLVAIDPQPEWVRLAGDPQSEADKTGGRHCGQLAKPREPRQPSTRPSGRCN